MTKKYKLPEEAMELFDAFQAYLDLRNKYIERPFGFRKAAKAGRLACTNQRKFWIKINTLYPELRGLTLNYDDGIVTVTE